MGFSQTADPPAPLGASATHTHVQICGWGPGGLTRLLWSPKAAHLLLLPPPGSLILEPDLEQGGGRMEVSKMVFSLFSTFPTCIITTPSKIPALYRLEVP